MENLKLRIKVRDCELEAEGPQTFVHEQFEAFKQLLADMTQKSVLSELRDETDRVPSQELSSPPRFPHEQALPKNSPAAALQKLLTWNDRTQQVTCAVIPEGHLRTADTVLLLLWGYQELRGLSEISAMILNRGLKSAGFSQFRLDRIMTPYLKDRLVLRSGVGKGGRYRLTTRGVEKAQDLVQTLAVLIPDPLP